MVFSRDLSLKCERIHLICKCNSEKATAFWAETQWALHFLSLIPLPRVLKLYFPSLFLHLLWPPPSLPPTLPLILSLLQSMCCMEWDHLAGPLSRTWFKLPALLQGCSEMVGTAPRVWKRSRYAEIALESSGFPDVVPGSQEHVQRWWKQAQRVGISMLKKIFSLK